MHKRDLEKSQLSRPTQATDLGAEIAQPLTLSQSLLTAPRMLLSQIKMFFRLMT
jgi:hypothetical protein